MISCSPKILLDIDNLLYICTTYKTYDFQWHQDFLSDVLHYQWRERLKEPNDQSKSLEEFLEKEPFRLLSFSILVTSTIWRPKKFWVVYDQLNTWVAEGICFLAIYEVYYYYFSIVESATLTSLGEETGVEFGKSNVQLAFLLHFDHLNHLVTLAIMRKMKNRVRFWGQMCEYLKWFLYLLIYAWSMLSGFFIFMSISIFLYFIPSIWFYT